MSDKCLRVARQRDVLCGTVVSNNIIVKHRTAAHLCLVNLYSAPQLFIRAVRVVWNSNWSVK